MTVEIRAATPADAAVIAGIESLAASHPWSARAVRDTLEAATGRGWLLVEGDRAVGHLISVVVAGEAELWTIAVTPDRRRQGLARRLLLHAMRAWRAEGAEAAYLEVRDDNAGAIALYTETGWAATAVRRGYYSDGTDARLMRCELGATDTGGDLPTP
jgi:ribosomal-protein-alanine N-acetyltransferase